VELIGCILSLLLIRNGTVIRCTGTQAVILLRPVVELIGRGVRSASLHPTNRRRRERPRRTCSLESFLTWPRRYLRTFDQFQ
jgi:hypothetical protein